MFTQMSAKKAIKSFTDCAVVAIVKEYGKLDDMNVLITENPDVLTHKKSENHLEL